MELSIKGRPCPALSVIGTHTNQMVSFVNLESSLEKGFVRGFRISSMIKSIEFFQ